MTKIINLVVISPFFQTAHLITYVKFKTYLLNSLQTNFRAGKVLTVLSTYIPINYIRFSFLTKLIFFFKYVGRRATRSLAVAYANKKF